MEDSLPPAMAADLMDTSLERDQPKLKLIMEDMVLELLPILAMAAALSVGLSMDILLTGVDTMERGLQMLKLLLRHLMEKGLLSHMGLLVMFMVLVLELLDILVMLPAS